MPFVYDKMKNKIKKCISLQVQKSNNKNHKERAFLYFLEKASLTLEASVVLTLFLLTVISIVYFLVILIMQANIQIRMEESARKIAKTEYVTNGFTGYSYLTLRNDLMTEEFVRYIDEGNIIGGIQGMNISRSSFINDEGLVDIVLSYYVKVPFIPDKLIILPFTQRCRFKVWIGDEINENAGEKQIVYVTLTGTVYHTNRNCTHLNLSIRKCNQEELKNQRNENGGIYEQCLLCKKEAGNSGTVYITDNGDKWHTILTCSGLKRTVMEIDIAEVGSRELCQRCKESR